MKRALFAGAIFVAAGIAALAAVPAWLPTGRALEAPSGAVARVGTLPLGLALSRDRSRLLVVEAGFNPPGLRILDAASLAERAFVQLNGAFGTPLVDEQGDGAWIAGANSDAILHLDLGKGAIDNRRALPKGCWPSSLARVDERLVVTCDELASVVVLAADGTSTVVPAGRHPNGIAIDPGKRKAYVSAWGEHGVDVVSLGNGTARLVQRIGVGIHPEALALAPDGRHLFVANTDDDSISIVDLRSLAQAPRIVRVPFDASGLVGNSLNSLAVSPDGKRLYASAGAANAIYAFSIGSGAGLKRLGAIPSGWYPTAVLATGAGLYVANGKGERSQANPQFDVPAFWRFQIEEDRLRKADPDYRGVGIADVPARRGHVAQELRGSIRAIGVPSDAQLRAGDARVRQLAGDSPLREHPVVRPNGPIRHVIYVIKENRTYDQVFGDLAGGDGDAKLVLFGEQITPNQHELARRFGVFDRTFADAQVSADGHNWSTAAFANDYVEKMWPPNYTRRRPRYDFESTTSAARPHAGYLWDAAVNAHLSLRNYGEFIYKTNESNTFSAQPGRLLSSRTDFRFPGYDLTISDLDRESEWEREFREFERTGNLPSLEIIRFPSDHTEGTKPGTLTPQAYVGQNDAAVGKLIDAVSHSRFWSSTAVFIIEDDCQNGADHVDDQRTVFTLASAFARPGVRHQMYTTAGVLRTIEIILGIPPMTTYDERAVPLYDAFAATPDARRFDAIAPKIDITARNASTAYRARDSSRLNFSRADAADEAALNDILWHAVKGAQATTPPYGRFPS